MTAGKNSVTSPYIIHREKLTVIARRHCKSPCYGLGAHISCCTQYALGRGEQSVTPIFSLQKIHRHLD